MEMRALASTLRKFNREYTAKIGLLEKYVLNTPYTFAQSRVLMEIGQNETCTAKYLSERLNMDQAFVSRIISQLVKRGEVQKEVSSMDRRVTHLRVTQKGIEGLIDLNEAANKQMEGFLDHLSEVEKDRVLGCVHELDHLLLNNKSHKQEHAVAAKDVTIRTNLKSGDAGTIIAMHGKIYEQECGYNRCFEGYVCKTFYEGLVHSREKDCYWIAEYNGEIVASVAVLEKEEGVAQLRWLLVKPEFRGMGLGRKLFSKAMAYVEERGFSRIFLETTREQEKAIGFYEDAGFVVTNSYAINDWGKELVGLTLERII